MVIFLSITMLIGSFVAGWLPLALTLSETKMRNITILGAGLLIGTALAVIIPEGIHTLYTVDTKVDTDHLNIKNDISHNHVGHKHRRSLEEKDLDIDPLMQLELNRKKRSDTVKDPGKADIDAKFSLEKSSDSSHVHKNENAHSAIGVTLVLGFIFMLIVDQIGGKISHRPHMIVDNQSVRNKITFSTTLGLVVHAAADGIALGAASATSKTDVEMIVFIAIMLHKAPAAFGLVSFLMHEGLERTRVRKHLVIFSLAAPLMAILTYVVLKSTEISSVSSNSTGLCMLFSAGTFLYVSTVHVLPEVQSHNEDRQFRFTEMLWFIAGSILPLLLSIGHSH